MSHVSFYIPEYLWSSEHIFGKYAEYMPCPDADAKIDLSHIALQSVVGLHVAQLVVSQYPELYRARFYERLKHGVVNDK